MNYDKFGIAYTTTAEICDMLYKDPGLDVSNFHVTDPDGYNQAIKSMYVEWPLLQRYLTHDAMSVDDFDQLEQSNWHMPTEYKQMDIAKFVLDKCNNEAELQRCGEELLLYQERGLFPLLQYLKYLVDVMRENNIVWGVGRGSSVASFVLYKIGIHKIDSLKYDLDPAEFLK